MADQLFEALQAVTDEATFICFVKALHADRVLAEDQPETADSFRGQWANQNISSFLEAALAWAEDSNFGERPGPKAGNPWMLCAQFLYCGKIYE